MAAQTQHKLLLDAEKSRLSLHCQEHPLSSGVSLHISVEMSLRAKFILRLFLIGLALIILGALLAVWKLSEDSYEATFLTPYIEKAVDHYLPGTHTKITHTVIQWNNLEHIISLHADDIKVTGNDDNVLAEIPNLDIGLSAWGIVRRKFMPVSVNIDRPHFRLIRDTNGMLNFGYLSTESKEASSDNSKSVRDSLAPILEDLTKASRFTDLNIKAVLLDVYDQKSNSDWSVHIPEIHIEHAVGGLIGHGLLSVTQKDQVSALELHYKYDADKKLHYIDTSLNQITPAFFAGGHPGTLGLGALAIFDLPLSGSVSIAVDNNVRLETVTTDLHGDAGTLNYPDFWEQPRSVKSLDLKSTYDKQAPETNLATLALDFDGPQLNITLKGGPSAVPEHDFDFDMAVQMDNWPMDEFSQLWPKPIIPNPREWIAKSLSKGMFDHGEASFKGALSLNDMNNPVISEGGGIITASRAHVDYLDGMPPVDGVNAKASFTMDQMSVDLSGGGIGALRLQPFTIQLTDFQKDVQYISIPLKFAGPITDILQLIDVPRLGYAKAIGLTPQDVGGTASGVVEMKFPLLNALEMKDVDIKAHADLTNVSSTKLVQKIDIEQGNVALNLEKTFFDVKGSANLNKISVQLGWKQYFEKQENKPLQQGSVYGTLGDEQWKQLNIDALKGTHGPVAATINITRPTKDVTIIDGNFDLTSAEIHIDQANWKKPAGIPAKFTVLANAPLDQPIKVKALELSGANAKIKGIAELSADGGQLLSLSLDPFIIGRSNGKLSYEIKADAAKTLQISFEGGALDVSGLKGGHDVAAADPRPKEYHIYVDKLYTSDKGIITDAQGYAIRDPQGWSEISLKGMADGVMPLAIDLGAKDGKRFFSAHSDNFGLALKGLGMTDTVSEGKISITGQSSADNPRVIEGVAKINRFTVKGLPALVVLLNATSPFGFQNLLTGKMDFDGLKGKFRWEGDNIELKDVNISGSAVGLEVNGKIDMDQGTANLHGIVAPFSMVNSILGSIPLIGDMLTGGNGGGVLAVAYTITGDLNDPKVSVNPASLLTPGFLRNIFFGGSDDDEDAPAADSGAIPPQQAFPSPNNLNKW